jgi:uncharacterized membrane protein
LISVSVAGPSAPSVQPIASRLSPARLEILGSFAFAAAVTLLVLEIVLPVHSLASVRAFFAAWPAFLAYLASFVALRWTWRVHRAVLGTLRNLDPKLARLNVLLLLLVVATPAMNLAMSHSLGNAGTERLAAIAYGLWLLVLSSVLGGLWRYARRHPIVLGGERRGTQIGDLSRVVEPNAVLIPVATAVALALPGLAAFLYLGIATGSLIRSR